MTKEPITQESFTAALEAAVNEKGRDYTYDGPLIMNQCMYFNLVTDEPCCIAGHALSHLGYGPDDVTEGRGIWEIFNDLEVGDSPLIRAATRAQSIQDDHGTWGEALIAYRSILAFENLQEVDDDDA